jgi:hypothetical protein
MKSFGELRCKSVAALAKLKWLPKAEPNIQTGTYRMFHEATGHDAFKLDNEYNIRTTTISSKPHR